MITKEDAKRMKLFDTESRIDKLLKEIEGNMLLKKFVTELPRLSTNEKFEIREELVNADWDVEFKDIEKSEGMQWDSYNVVKTRISIF